MKYFILRMGKACSFVPRINDQNISRELIEALNNKNCFMNLPKHMLIPVTTIEQTVWTDILDSPVLLLSKEFIKVVEIYGDMIYSKEVILLDQENVKSKTYCLSRIVQVEGNMNYYKGDEKKLKAFNLNPTKNVNRWSNIFQIRIKKDIYTIVNLDLAESLLRRDLEGIGLEETIVIGI